MHPDSFAIQLIHLYNRIDTTIAGHYEAFPKKAQLQPCRKGCHFCCSQFFEISEGESMVIMHHLQTLPNTKLGNLKIKIEKAYQQFITLYPTFYATYFEHSNNEVFNVDAYFEDETRFDIKITCPFLSGSGECEIYAVRPLVCRTTGSGYTQTFDDDEICKIIPSALEARKWQVSLEKYEEEIWGTNELKSLTDNEEEIIELRQYPLFYAFFELLCTPSLLDRPFNNPWLHDYFELSRHDLELKIKDQLIF